MTELSLSVSLKVPPFFVYKVKKHLTEENAVRDSYKKFFGLTYATRIIKEVAGKCLSVETSAFGQSTQTEYVFSKQPNGCEVRIVMRYGILVSILNLGLAKRISKMALLCELEELIAIEKAYHLAKHLTGIFKER